jgi:cardiolipin synthase
MKQKWLLPLLRRRFFVILLLLVQLSVIIYTAVSGSIASQLVSQVLTVLSILVCLYIVARGGTGAYKLIWIFMILLFPVFGGLLYLLFSFQGATKKFSRQAAKTEAKAKGLLAFPGTSEKALLETLPDCAAQVHYLQNHAGFPVYTDTETTYLSPGEEKYDALLRELSKAERYIFLEYFIIQEGMMWNSILEILKQKAAEGVKVRVLYDDLGCFLKLPKDYDRQLQEMGIDCQIFNRFKPVLASMQNNRDHRKIAVIDGKTAFTGGINLADEYINAIERFGHWKDASVMIRGKAAWSFTLMFLQMWELASGEDEDYAQYYPWILSDCPVKASGFVQPYADSPMDKENVGEHVYLQIINNAKEYLYINTPYLIIDENMMSALCLAAKSGVDVRIVTPHKWDKRFVHMTTQSYYRDLMATGVRIYEYTRGFIHSKTFVSDDTVATVGTTNLDFRSLYLSFECGTLMYRTDAVSQVKEDFLNTLEQCHEITEKDTQCGPIKRVFQDVLRLFAPLM